MSQNTPDTAVVPASVKAYSRYLLFIAGLGGLLYGVDVGIISGALPYIKDTAGYSESQLSQVVAAVLFGSVLSSLFAGLLSDIFGRKPIVICAALLFSLSIPVITLSDSFSMLMLGRILQGVSAGLIGVVVPLYLAECLAASSRGKGTGMFQFLLTVGLVFAALIALFTGFHVEGVENSAGVTQEIIHNAKDSAWRTIFWVSIVPGLIMFLGAFFLTESPRWLFRRGRKDEALAALMRGNAEPRAREILAEMEQIEREETEAREARKAAHSSGETLVQRKYIIPFVLAVIILACTQATGINSVLNYSVMIFQQGGLEGLMGNYGDTALKIVNCAMTVVAVMLVDKMGRKFLLKLGTSGIIVGLVGAAIMFMSIEKSRVNVTDALAGYVDHETASMNLSLKDPALLSALNSQTINDDTQLIVTYEQTREIAPDADVSLWERFQNWANAGGVRQVVVDFKDKEVDGVKVASTLKINPMEATELPTVDGMEVLKAELGQKPGQGTGWMIAIFFIIFISFYAVGPGVCVWLALSELMPTRIRSNGMAIALLINQGVSTTIAGTFLPWVGNWGYSGVFLTLAGCTVIYFITAAFFLPETKGKTLEEIEEYFSGKKGKANA